MGTWKLNESKSKIGTGSPKNNTVVIESAGQNVKNTMDGVDPTGKPTHSEWTGKFDGREYPIMGDANSDTRSYKTIDDRTFEVSANKAGKATVSGRVVVSADGKTRTAHVKGYKSFRPEVRNDCGLRQAIDCFNFADIAEDPSAQRDQAEEFFIRSHQSGAACVVLSVIAIFHQLRTVLRQSN